MQTFIKNRFYPFMQAIFYFLTIRCILSSNTKIYFNDLKNLTETDESAKTAVYCAIMKIIGIPEHKKRLIEFVNLFKNKKIESETPSYCKTILYEILKSFFANDFTLEYVFGNGALLKTIDKKIDTILQKYYADKELYYHHQCFQDIVILFVNSISLDYDQKKKFISCYYDINNNFCRDNRYRDNSQSKMKTNLDDYVAKAIGATHNTETLSATSNESHYFCIKEFNFEFLLIIMEQVKRKNEDQNPQSNAAKIGNDIYNGTMECALPNVVALQTHLGTITILINLTPIIFRYLHFLTKYQQIGNGIDSEYLDGTENDLIDTFYNKFTASFETLSRNGTQKYIELARQFSFEMVFYWICDTGDLAYCCASQISKLDSKAGDLVQHRIYNLIDKFLKGQSNEMLTKILFLKYDTHDEDDGYNYFDNVKETDESLTTAICCVIMKILAAGESKKQVAELLNAFLNNKDESKTPSYCKSFLLEILKDFFGTRYMLARALEDKSFETLDKRINAILREHYQDRNFIYRFKCFRFIVVLFVDGISLDYKLKKKFIVCYYEINNATILQEQSKLLAGSKLTTNCDLNASKVISAAQNMKTTLSAKEVCINFCQKQFDFEFLIMTMEQVKRKEDQRKLSNTSMADKNTINGGATNVDDNLQSKLGKIVILINLTPLIINYLQFLNNYLQAGNISDPEKFNDIENETVNILYHELTLSYHNLSKNIKQKYIDLVHLFGFKLSFYWIGDIEDIAYSGSFQSNRTNGETLDLIENKLTNFIGKFLLCSENDLTLKMLLLANKQQAEDKEPVYLCIAPNLIHSF